CAYRYLCLRRPVVRNVLWSTALRREQHDGNLRGPDAAGTAASVPGVAGDSAGARCIDPQGDRTRSKRPLPECTRSARRADRAARLTLINDSYKERSMRTSMTNALLSLLLGLGGGAAMAQDFEI